MERVLVLCQRKSSPSDGPRGRVYVQDTVAHIDRYVDQLFPATIEYLTDGTGDDYGADYKFKLSYRLELSDNPDAKKFVKDHKDQYSLVILNSCPFIFTKFELIHQVLKDDGVMVVKSFDPDDATGEYSPADKLKTLETLANIDRVKQLEKFFVEDTSGRFGSFAYKKKPKPPKSPKPPKPPKSPKPPKPPKSPKSPKLKRSKRIQSQRPRRSQRLAL
jgi:hypothetical protein